MKFVEVEHRGLKVRTTVPESRVQHLSDGWALVNPVDVLDSDPEDDTVDGVLAEVGDDPVKAAAALEAEKAGKNRSSLVERLSRKTTPQ